MSIYDNLSKAALRIIVGGECPTGLMIGLNRRSGVRGVVICTGTRIVRWRFQLDRSTTISFIRINVSPLLTAARYISVLKDIYIHRKWNTPYFVMD